MTRWTYPNIRWWSWCWYDKLLQQFRCFVNCRTRNTWDADCWSKDAFLPSASATAGGCCSCCNRLPSNDKRVYSRRYRVLLGAITGPRWPPPSPPPPPTPTLYSSLKSDCQKTSRVNGHLLRGKQTRHLTLKPNVPDELWMVIDMRDSGIHRKTSHHHHHPLYHRHFHHYYYSSNLTATIPQQLAP